MLSGADSQCAETITIARGFGRARAQACSWVIQSVSLGFTYAITWAYAFHAVGNTTIIGIISVALAGFYYKIMQNMMAAYLKGDIGYYFAYLILPLTVFVLLVVGISLERSDNNHQGSDGYPKTYTALGSVVAGLALLDFILFSIYYFMRSAEVRMVLIYNEIQQMVLLFTVAVITTMNNNCF